MFRFELAVQLGDLRTAYDIAMEAEVNFYFIFSPIFLTILEYLLLNFTETCYFRNTLSIFQSEQKWKHLAELAIQKCEFALAQECLYKAQDYAGLLLLASCSGDAVTMEKLAVDAEKNGKYNVAFLAYHSLGRYEDCLDRTLRFLLLPSLYMLLSSACTSV